MCQLWPSIIKAGLLLKNGGTKMRPDALRAEI
jgi:hypothetical protein